MPITNTEYRWIAHAVGVLQCVGAEVTVIPGGDAGDQLSIILDGYDPPEPPEPGEPSAVVMYLLEMAEEQTGFDVSEDAHIIAHLEAIVPSLRNGSDPQYQIPFTVETERGLETRYLVINSQDPHLQELLDL